MLQWIFAKILIRLANMLVYFFQARRITNYMFPLGLPMDFAY